MSAHHNTLAASIPKPSDSASKQTNHLVWVDALKGIGIVLVVFGHALRGSYARDLIPSPIFNALDPRIYSFHMPLFFVVSGLFLYRTISRSKSRHFLYNLLERILYPLVIWTYAFLIFKYAAGDFSNRPVSFQNIFVLPFLGREHLWFLWALFQVQLIVFLAYLAVPKLSPVWFAISMLALSVLLRFLPLPLTWMPWVSHAIFSLPFLSFGLLIGTQLSRVSVTPMLGWVSFLLCLMGILIAPLFNGSFLLPLAIITCLSLTTIAFNDHIVMRYCAVLGRASMAIYLTHTIFSAAFREAMLVLSITDPFAHLSITTFVGLLGGYLLYWRAHQLGISRYFGFR